MMELFAKVAEMFSLKFLTGFYVSDFKKRRRKRSEKEDLHVKQNKASVKDFVNFTKPSFIVPRSLTP